MMSACQVDNHNTASFPCFHLLSTKSFTISPQRPTHFRWSRSNSTQGLRFRSGIALLDLKNIAVTLLPLEVWFPRATSLLRMYAWKTLRIKATNKRQTYKYDLSVDAVTSWLMSYSVPRPPAGANFQPSRPPPITRCDLPTDQHTGSPYPLAKLSPAPTQVWLTGPSDGNGLVNK